jgi:hypothetical protein
MYSPLFYYNQICETQDYGTNKLMSPWIQVINPWQIH